MNVAAELPFVRRPPVKPAWDNTPSHRANSVVAAVAEAPPTSRSRVAINVAVDPRLLGQLKVVLDDLHRIQDITRHLTSAVAATIELAETPVR